jgi:hypothetical protein
MMRGTIKHLWKGLGYGMIGADDKSTPDLIFLVGDVNGIPEMGDSVAFDFMADPSRPGRLRAMNIIRNPGEPEPTHPAPVQ